MKKYCILLVFSFLFFVSFSQSNIKTMFYNMLNFPSSFQITDDMNRLNRIVNEYQPDLFLVSEIVSLDAEQWVLQKVLNITDNKYKAVTYHYNSSGTPTFNNLQQLAFYNSQKLILVNERYIQTYLRDINHYTFKLNTDDNATNPIYLEVFVAHLKAGNTESDMNGRNAMITNFVTATNNNLIPSNSFVLFAGDLNLYYSDEPAYQNLLNPANTIKLIDPINSPGSWTNNTTFQTIHTQSTRTGSLSDSGASGGLDDRFDFILMSPNLVSNATLSYVPNSYKSFGNNGNCFNKNINNTTCTGTFSQQLRDDLYYFSDHLPVVMELKTPKSLSIAEYTSNHLSFVGSNITSTQLIINTSDELLGSEILIYNQLGKVVKKIPINYESTSDKNIYIDVQNLSNGVYIIINSKVFMKKPLKFIKN